MFDGAAMEELGRKLAGADASLADDAVLMAAAIGLERLRRFLDSAEAKVLAELDHRDCCDREHGLSTSTWLAREAELPPGTARRRVAVANTLRRHLPATAAALEEGRIGWDHARVMADAANPRIREQLAAIEEELVAAADGCTFDRWRREVQGLAELLDQDGGYDPADDPAANHLHLSDTGGTTAVTGTLVGETALITARTLERVADELFRRFTSDAGRDPSLTVPGRPALLALALAEVCRRATAVPLGATRPAAPEATYLVRAEDPFERATTPHGTVLQDGSLRVLRCSEDLRAVIVDSLGTPLDMGRRIPFPSPSQRRALEARDGGCVFPGCDAPPTWCDSHHVDERRAGGHTDVRRMALLCRHHHTVTHRRGWQMDLTADQWAVWRTPSGATLHGQRHGRRRPDRSDAEGPCGPHTAQPPDG